MGKIKKNLRENLWQMSIAIYPEMAFLQKSCLRTVALCHKFTKNRHGVVSLYTENVISLKE